MKTSKSCRTTDHSKTGGIVVTVLRVIAIILCTLGSVIGMLYSDSPYELVGYLFLGSYVTFFVDETIKFLADLGGSIYD